MIAPLDVNRVVGHHLVHDDMRSRTSVIDIAYDMKMIDRQALNQFAERYDKGFRPSHTDNRLDDRIVVGFLVLQIAALRQKFFQYIGKFLRKCLADLRTRVLARCPAADCDQTVQGDLVPVIRILLRLQNPAHLLRRIVNKGRQRLLVLTAQGISKYIVNLSLDGTGTIFQYMGKCLVFPMDIGQEMFRSFRQI